MTEMLPNDPRHGTWNGYSNLHCRCGLCREAWAACIEARRQKRQPPPPDDPRHGKETTYGNWNCRCDACRRAHAAALKARRERKRAGS